MRDNASCLKPGLSSASWSLGILWGVNTASLRAIAARHKRGDSETANEVSNLRLCRNCHKTYVAVAVLVTLEVVVVRLVIVRVCQCQQLDLVQYMIKITYRCSCSLGHCCLCSNDGDRRWCYGACALDGNYIWSVLASWEPDLRNLL